MMISLTDKLKTKVMNKGYYGDGCYVVTLQCMEKSDYLEYLSYLEEQGFEKYVDNKDGLEGVVFTATYTKEKQVLTISYMQKTQKGYIAFSMNQALSPNLIYNSDHLAGNQPGARTSLHMLEMYWYGNSFVIQLKNGHFIVSDGGLPHEICYLLDYLEELTPEGEKPVIEAWFITHAHVDHCGALGELGMDDHLRERLYVEGIYFNEPGNSVMPDPWLHMMIARMKVAAGVLRTTQNKHPKIYRPQTGQRYYFDDITMDILHCQEQLPPEDYKCQDYKWDFNDSSTWYLFTIEGQKVLFTGDGDVGSMEVLRQVYGKEHLGVDVMTLMHHGFNTWKPFTDDCLVTTILQTSKDKMFPPRREDNAYLKERTKEWLAWGDGTKILRFPYAVGEYECLPQREWIYHKGQERPEQPNVGW